MYEEVMERCDNCRGAGVAEYVTEYGPFGRSIMETCHECEGEGFIVKLIEVPYEEE